MDSEIWFFYNCHVPRNILDFFFSTTWTCRRYSQPVGLRFKKEAVCPMWPRGISVPTSVFEGPLRSMSGSSSCSQKNTCYLDGTQMTEQMSPIFSLLKFLLRWLIILFSPTRCPEHISTQTQSSRHRIWCRAHLSVPRNRASACPVLSYPVRTTDSQV